MRNTLHVLAGGGGEKWSVATGGSVTISTSAGLSIATGLPYVSGALSNYDLAASTTNGAIVTSRSATRGSIVVTAPGQVGQATVAWFAWGKGEPNG